MPAKGEGSALCLAHGFGVLWVVGEIFPSVICGDLGERWVCGYGERVLGLTTVESVV